MLINHTSQYDLTFRNRITNIWNSSPFEVPGSQCTIIKNI